MYINYTNCWSFTGVTTSDRYYYYYVCLTAFFQDNLGKSAPDR